MHVLLLHLRTLLLLIFADGIRELQRKITHELVGCSSGRNRAVGSDLLHGGVFRGAGLRQFKRRIVSDIHASD